MNKSLLLVFLVFAGTWVSGQVSMHKQRTEPHVGLVAYYPFNGNANDESGNGSNPTYIGAGVTLTSDRFGNPDKAYYFDGNADSYIRIPADKFPTTDRTISFWFNADKIENHPTPLSYGGDACHNSVLMIINKGDFPNSYTVLSHCASNFISAPYSEDPVNKWYYLTMTISGATQKIFINGELLQTANTFGTPTVVAGKSAILGAILFTDGVDVYNEPTAGNFKGKMDDFRFYNKAMTDSEVFSLYKSEAEDLIAFYPFDGNALDASGNGYDGTVYGSILTEDRNNNQNSAYTFPNLHDQIVLANTTNLILQGGFTLNAWVKYKNVNCGIVGKHNCWTPNGFLLGIEDGQFTLWISNGGWQIIKTNETFEENKWYMISAVYDSVNKTGMLYIDGKLKASGVAIYSNLNTANITISESSGSCPSGNMPGAVDEVKIFSRPLTAPEILSEFYSTQVGLVAFFPFSGNADDASGNQNHGTVHNSVLAKDRFGITDKSFLFEGTDSYIEGTNPGNNLPVGNSPRTISAWIKEYSFHPWGNNIFHYGTDQAAPTNFHLYTTDVIRVGNGYDFGVVAGSTPIVDSTWHFVAGVYEGGSEHVAKVYVDGKLNNTGNLSSEPNTILGSNWKIGRFMTGSNNFDGRIDDLRIYSAALTDQEIENLYLSETTAPQLLEPKDLSFVSNSAPLMEWSGTISNVEYTFQLCGDPVFSQILYQSKTSQLNIQLPEGLVQENVIYFWRVRTTLNGETGPWSPVWSFNIINTGLGKRTGYDAAIRIYPSPANQKVKITYTLPGTITGGSQVTIEIVNSAGKCIKTLAKNYTQPGANEIEVETRSMPSGMYYCRLKAGNITGISKLVIIH